MKKLIFFILITTLLLSFIGCSKSSQSQQSQIATVESISYQKSIDGRYYISVSIAPRSVMANETYKVELYQNGKLRESQNVSWFNIILELGSGLDNQTLAFYISDSEYQTFRSKSASSIFSVKIRE